MSYNIFSVEWRKFLKCGSCLLVSATFTWRRLAYNMIRYANGELQATYRRLIDQSIYTKLLLFLFKMIDAPLCRPVNEDSLLGVVEMNCCSGTAAAWEFKNIIGMDQYTLQCC